MTETVHTFTDDALGDLDAVGLAAEIRSGRVGRQEVTEAAIARVEKVDPQLNAVQFACFERARTARASVGVFSGVPAFVKDNADVAGLPTCHGSAAFVPHPARHTAAPAEQFLRQGFVLLGKSTLPEFGLTAGTEYVGRPATRNPWNTDHSAGASSGGSAAPRCPSSPPSGGCAPEPRSTTTSPTSWRLSAPSRRSPLCSPAAITDPPRGPAAVNLPQPRPVTGRGGGRRCR